jgi:hypothetical protein
MRNIARNTVTKAFLKPKMYTDGPKKDKEGNLLGGDFYIPGKAHYYADDSQRNKEIENIKAYYRSIFKGDAKVDKVVRVWCIYDSCGDKEVYRKTSFQIIREIIDVNLRKHELCYDDDMFIARVDKVLEHLDSYKKLHPTDYSILVNRFAAFKLPIYRDYSDKYLQSTYVPLIKDLADKDFKDLTVSEIVGKRLIVANNFEECWAIRGELIKEGFDADIVSRNVIATLEAIAGNN